MLILAASGATVGAGGEGVDDLPRVSRPVLFVREIHEDVSMGRWRPLVVKRTFEFDRPDEQARHVAAIGVLAANCNFTHACEVIDVILFDVGAGVIANRIFKDEAGELVRRGIAQGLDTPI